MLSSSSGNGLIIIGNEHSEIKILASDEEHKIITTNADERLKNEIENSNEVVTKFENLSIDLSKGFYKMSELNNNEIEELKRNGYVESSHVGLFGGRKEDY